ncbi:threonine synthase, partial [Bacillus paralicheniformis]
MGSIPTAPANFNSQFMAVVAKWLTHQIVALALV